MREIGAALRKAKSLLAIHLSGNPGVTPELKEYLYDRIRAKNNINFDYFKEAAVANYHSPHSSRVT